MDRVTNTRFITFEGGEGTGKSTQARLLADALRQSGSDVLLTREPGGTPGAEAVRGLLLHPPGKTWSGRAEALLFAAARADHVASAIVPALRAGRWVICDRFVDSSRAYQGFAGGDGEDVVMAMHDLGSGGLLPSRTVLLTGNVEAIADRLARRDGDTADVIAARGPDHHRGVMDAFDAFAAAEPQRFVRIDGDGDPTTVHRRVCAALGIAPLVMAR